METELSAVSGSYDINRLRAKVQFNGDGTLAGGELTSAGEDGSAFDSQTAGHTEPLKCTIL